MKKIVLTPDIKVQSLRAVPGDVSIVNMMGEARANGRIYGLEGLRNLHVSAGLVSQVNCVEDKDFSLFAALNHQTGAGQYTRTRRSEISINGIERGVVRGGEEIEKTERTRSELHHRLSKSAHPVPISVAGCIVGIPASVKCAAGSAHPYTRLSGGRGYGKNTNLR